MLLTIVFRSIWVPIKAALGYVLSAAAAFGAVTLVFNQGWAKQVINLPEAVPVISFLPIILMGILFKLAMDYEVFLVSRMREEHVHGNTVNPVEEGFVHSGQGRRGCRDHHVRRVRVLRAGRRGRHQADRVRAGARRGRRRVPGAHDARACSS